MTRVFAGSLRKDHVGQTVTLNGWVQKRRDFGELIFIDLRDRGGICQVVVDRERGASADVVAAAKELRGEFVVRIEGEVFERADAQKNAKLPTGDVEVVAKVVTILNRADTPPFAIEDDTDAAEELRLQYRYLDLRRPSLAGNLVLRSKMLTATRNYFDGLGFIEVETPILTKSTPEGARDYLVPSRVHKGEFYALPQSPQIFKQLCMVAGLERYFQIARCFRDEDLRRDRQPEFTQIDVECSFIDEEFIYALMEGLFEKIFPLAGIAVTTPFPRMTWQEAMDRFGIDRPDTRFGMELVDITDAAKTTSFEPFKAAATVRAIVVPGGASFSRKRIDELTEDAKKLGASGLVWIKFDAQRGSSIKKFLDDAAFDALRAALHANENDLALVVAGKQTVVWDVLANLRLRVARDEKLIPDDRWDFLWVTDFPLYEWDDESQRFFARHHPFTSPRPEHLELLDSDPGAVLARAYDVVLNGIELGGGSIRINQPDVQQRMFQALGISAEDAQARFGFLIDAFRYGAPPHGGIALGVDRLAMLMSRSESLRDVIAFPKTARAQDLMCAAPSDVDAKQLDELGIALKR
ncbi:MAG: aspartate--tRNA ligase [Acidobacteria bacterium]|nr:aspartate--tRNA ligase [Acidobacteriota bacterium]MBV9474518.1 aspartate--tRNA ligase [Acidobacteriota bacterium]